MLVVSVIGSPHAALTKVESESQHVRGVIINFEGTKHLVFSKNFIFIFKILLRFLKQYVFKTL